MANACFDADDDSDPDGNDHTHVFLDSFEFINLFVLFRAHYKPFR